MFNIALIVLPLTIHHPASRMVGSKGKLVYPQCLGHAMYRDSAQIQAALNSVILMAIALVVACAGVWSTWRSRSKDAWIPPELNALDAVLVRDARGIRSGETLERACPANNADQEKRPAVRGVFLGGPDSVYSTMATAVWLKPPST
jgi:hypothetical protein